jgi:hypothetical protein
MGLFDFLFGSFGASGAQAAQQVTAQQPTTSTGQTYAVQTPAPRPSVQVSQPSPQPSYTSQPSQIQGGADRSPYVAPPVPFSSGRAAMYDATWQPLRPSAYTQYGQQGLPYSGSLDTQPSRASIPIHDLSSRTPSVVFADTNAGYTPGTDIFMTSGGYQPIRIRDSKIVVGENTGEFGVYQPTYDPNTGKMRRTLNLVGGGGRAALQSGMFSREESMAPAGRTYEQWEIGKIGVPSQKYMDTHSRLGAEAYGGFSTELSGKLLTPNTQMSTYANPLNLANLVNPQGANMSKSEAPGINIPWGIGVDSPQVQYADERGLNGRGFNFAESVETSMRSGGLPKPFISVGKNENALTGTPASTRVKGSGPAFTATTPWGVEVGMGLGYIPKPFMSVGKGPSNLEKSWSNVLAGEGWGGLSTILPQTQRFFLPKPSEVHDTLSAHQQKGMTPDFITDTITNLYAIPYGQVRGAETVRLQERYDIAGADIFSEQKTSEKQYSIASSELESVLSKNKQYVSLDKKTNTYVFAVDTPKGVSDEVTSKFDIAKSSYTNLELASFASKMYDEKSPTQKLSRETTSAFGVQKPFEMFGIQPTLEWKKGVEGIASPLIGETGILTKYTSTPSTNPAESIFKGVADFPTMSIQMVADTPMAVEMATRDILNRGTEGFSTMGGYGQASFGKMIVDDPVRGVTMLATGALFTHGTGMVKSKVMRSSGLERLSTFEVAGDEVVASATATRTISDVLTGKDFVGVTHSAPSPIVKGLALITRESAGDVAHGMPKHGTFGALISKSISTAKTLFEPTSEYFLNKPLLRPAIENTGLALYQLSDAALGSRDFAPAKASLKRASRGYTNFAMRHIPVVGGSRVYIAENVETMAPQMRGKYSKLASEMKFQLEATGKIEPAIYDQYMNLAYEVSASQGGKPIAVISPKKASGYHLGDKGAMGAPFENEIYMVAAENVGGVITPLPMIEFASKQFAGYAHGASGAKVVKINLRGQTPSPTQTLGSILKENRAFNADVSKSPYSPYNTLWKMNIGGSTIQRGWYEAMKQDAIFKAQEMYGEPGSWAPKDYYGKHGYEHSMAVVGNMREIIARSPETQHRLGGAASADRYANAMGLSHDIAKIGEAETQPYTHAFITAEGLRTGELRAQMGRQTYDKMFGGLSSGDLTRVGKAVSEHTQIQPLRAPALRDILNWNRKMGIEGERGHLSDLWSGIKTTGDPAKGVVSKLLWRPDIEGRTLATADRMDIGRVGSKVKPSKLFRTPEEQREANVNNLIMGATIGASAISMKMGLPPVTLAFTFTKDFMNPNPRGMKSGYKAQSNPISYAGLYNKPQFRQYYSLPIKTGYSNMQYPEYKKYSVVPSYINNYEKDYPYQTPYKQTYYNSYLSKSLPYVAPYKDYDSGYVPAYKPQYSQYKSPYEGYSKYQKPYEGYSKYQKPYEGYSKYQKPYEYKPHEYKPYVPYDYQKPYDYTPITEKPKPPMPLTGGSIGGISGGIFAPRRLTRWQRDNPVADMPYLSRGLGGSGKTSKKKPKFSFGGNPFG